MIQKLEKTYFAIFSRSTSWLVVPVDILHLAKCCLQHLTESDERIDGWMVVVVVACNGSMNIFQISIAPHYSSTNHAITADRFAVSVEQLAYIDCIASCSLHGIIKSVTNKFRTLFHPYVVVCLLFDVRKGVVVKTSHHKTVNDFFVRRQWRSGGAVAAACIQRKLNLTMKM